MSHLKKAAIGIIGAMQIEVEALCAAMTFGIIALMIVVGIWYPARKAMSVQPAEALHAE